jgi:hypothetical protein
MGPAVIFWKFFWKFFRAHFYLFFYSPRVRWRAHSPRGTRTAVGSIQRMGGLAAAAQAIPPSVIGVMAVIATIAPHAEPTRAKSAVGG